MKKRSVVLMVLAMVMILSMSFAMASCGEKEDPTLESYIASDEEAKAEIEEMAEANDLAISIVGNELTYTYKYDETFDADLAEMLAGELESAMGSMNSTFSGIAADLEEETGISGITVVVIYQNGDGSELYSETFTAE